MGRAARSGTRPYTGQAQTEKETEMAKRSSQPDVCRGCWHEDCTCGTTVEERQAAANRDAVAEAARRLRGK
jgi:hypothetical protein